LGSGVRSFAHELWMSPVSTTTLPTLDDARVDKNNEIPS
jgi:hypothetical protein